jgi:hypothetical protein
MVLVITPSTALGLSTALRRLRNRSLAPVLILLDSSSFGALSDNAALAAEAARAAIPTRVVRCGDALEAALSTPAHLAGLRPAA